MAYLWDVLISITLGLIFTGIYWVIGFFCKSTFNFEIRSEMGYRVCMIGGFVAVIVLVQLLKR